MKIALWSLAVLGVASGAARADIGLSHDGYDVELYGILDAGIGTLEHSYSAASTFASTVNPYNLNSSPNSFTGMYSGGISMSRVGVRGATDLWESGAQAFFRVESAINVTSGVLANNGQSLYNDINGLHAANGASAINGQYFSRAAYAGITAPLWGTLELGRTTNFALDQVGQYDPVQAALLYSPLGFSGGIGGGLGATENSRLDNSIKYENELAGVRFGAQYKLAGDKNAQSAGYGWVGMLGYSVGGLSLEGTYSQQTNTVAWATQYSNVVAPDPNLQIENTKGYMLTAMYRLGEVAAVKAGFEYLTIDAPSNPNLTGIQNYFGLILPEPAVNATGEQRFVLGWVGGDYHITPAFDLAAGFYECNTYNEPEAGKAYLAQVYSLLADYDFTKRFDVYLGVMAIQYSGAGLTKKTPVLAYSSNGMYGVGLRFKF
jgi:general bacterial porin, GBP family